MLTISSSTIKNEVIRRLRFGRQRKKPDQQQQDKMFHANFIWVNRLMLCLGKLYSPVLTPLPPRNDVTLEEGMGE